MADFKVGDVCRCKEHPMCFFVPGSIVEITTAYTNGSEDCVTAKLLFGKYKDNPDLLDRLEYNQDSEGGAYCYMAELEKVDDLET